MKDTKNRIIRGQTNILDEMTEYIDDAVYYAVIIDYGDVWSEVDESVVRTLLFSRGTKEYQIKFDWSGTVINYSKKTPKHMLMDIHNAICGQYLNGIYNELLLQDDEKE